MRRSNRWRVQKGSRVRYTTGHSAGTATVMAVVKPPMMQVGDGLGVYLVQDAETQAEHTVSGNQIIFDAKSRNY